MGIPITNLRYFVICSHQTVSAGVSVSDMPVWAALDVYGLTATGDGGASASGVTLPEALRLCDRAGGRDGTMVACCGCGSLSGSVLRQTAFRQYSGGW